MDIRKKMRCSLTQDERKLHFILDAVAELGIILHNSLWLPQSYLIPPMPARMAHPSHGRREIINPFPFGKGFYFGSRTFYST